MKKIVFASIIVLICSSFCVASEPQVRLGAGPYALKFCGNGHSDNFDGKGVSAMISADDHVAGRVSAYFLENDSYEYDIDITGIDVAILLGYVANKGFNIYAGPSVFFEEVSSIGLSYKNEGFGIVAGTGYTWDKIAFNLDFSGRHSNDYEDLLGEEGLDIMITSLGVSYIF